MSATKEESTTGRTIDKIVPATHGKITRLLGTVDCDGAGTKHALADVDPFILCDYGTIGKNKMPPFGAHPHRGHSVVTILLGGQVQSWDSFLDGTEDPLVLKAPASYWVDAGTGVFHEEHSVIEDESDPSQHMRLLQLWVGVTEADRQKPPRVQHDQDLPIVDCLGSKDGSEEVVGKATYYIGGPSASHKSTIETPHPIQVVHIVQQPGTTYNLPVNPVHGGFVVILQGQGTFGGATPTQDCDVMVLSTDDSQGDSLQIETPSSSATPTEYAVCTGQRNDDEKEPWAKKLVANGAIIAKTAEEARAMAPKVEEMSKSGKQEGGSFAPFGR